MTLDSTEQRPAASVNTLAVSVSPRRRTDRALSTRALSTSTGQPSGSSASRPDLTPDATPHLRSSALLLLNENLARARMREMERSAEDIRRAYRLLAARRWQRRARNAARRARMAQTAIW